MKSKKPSSKNEKTPAAPGKLDQLVKLSAEDADKAIKKEAKKAAKKKGGGA